jgi:tau tubulin kinase
LAGFVHRDMKPSNFAVDKWNPDIVVIFDFGLARHIFLENDASDKVKLHEPRSKVNWRTSRR